jgi:hypothetical protein
MSDYEKAYEKAMGEKKPEKKPKDKSLTEGQPPERPPEPPRFKASATAGQPPERPPEPPRYQEPKPVTDVVEQAKILGLPGGAEPMLRPVEDTTPGPAEPAVPIQAPTVPTAPKIEPSVTAPEIVSNAVGQLPPPVQAKLEQAISEIQDDPKIGNQLLNLAKDTGKSILELIQGFAYGYAGTDKPLASEVRQAEKMKKMDLEAQRQQRMADEQFQMTLAQLQNDWMQRRFQATTSEEKAAADKEYDFKKSEAAKDRSSTERVAGLRQTEQKKSGKEQAKQQILDILRGK